jgi:hypothetical protein
MMYGILIQAALVVFIAAGSWYHGYRKGDDAARAEYAARDLQAAREAQIAYAGIASRYRAKEQAQAQSFAAVSTAYQRKLDANATALLAAGAVRLFDPGSRVQACGDTAAATPASPGGNNEGRGTALSQELASFLIAEANRADGIVLRLTACQAILRSERD